MPVVSNLAGKGPDNTAGEAHEVRYSGVATVRGVTLDLVMTNESPYTSFNQETRNPPRGAGVENCQGWIPIKTGTNTRFKFVFVATGTNTPVVLDKFAFTILDFDAQNLNWWANEHEYVVFHTQVEGGWEQGSNVARVGVNNGTMRMESTLMGDTADNPTSFPLTAEQASKTVEVFYTNRAEFELTFGHEFGNPDYDRQFYFYGRMFLTPIDWKLCKSDGTAVDYDSNLAGQGPDVTKAPELRYYEVAEVNGFKLDLVVSTLTSYTSDNQQSGEKPGSKYPCIGWIPIKTNTHTKFEFSFVKTTTSEVYMLEAFAFTILDFDAEISSSSNPNQWPNEKEYAILNTVVAEWELGSNVTEFGSNEGCMTLESKVKGVESDNPTTLPLTSEQIAKAAQVMYKHTGVWEVTLGHKDGNVMCDRQFYFAGKTRECAPTAIHVPCTSPVDVILVLDKSGSIGSVGWDESVNAALGMTDLVDANTAMGVIYYSSTVSSHSPLTHDRNALKTKVEELKKLSHGGLTKTSAAVDKARLDLQQHGRTGSEKVVIVVTDGYPNSVSATDTAVSALKADGVTLMFVPVGSNLNMNDINRWASDPSLVFQASNYAALNAHIVNNVIPAVCPATRTTTGTR